jgi:hypothetical protein
MKAIHVAATFGRGPLYIAGVAALLLGALAIGVLFVTHPNRAQTPVALAQTQPKSSPTAAPVRAEELAAAPVASIAPFQCGASTLTAAGAPSVATINAVRTGSHPGYDRLVVQFSSKQPVSIELRPQATSAFVGSPRGDAITLAGGRGLVVLARGTDMHTAYTGARDFKTSYPGLREVRVIEDFEGQVMLGLGVSGSNCYRAFTLTNPVRLVVDIQTS